MLDSIAGNLLKIWKDAVNGIISLYNRFDDPTGNIGLEVIKISNLS